MNYLLLTLRRMYTRIALGKNSAMDVVAGESRSVHTCDRSFHFPLACSYFLTVTNHCLVWTCMTADGAVAPAGSCCCCTLCFSVSPH